MALGVAFLAYGAAVLLPNGNGLIAVFVAAIVLGIRRPDMREAFAKQSLDLVEIVKLGIFAVFGSLLTWHGLTSTGWAGLGVALVTLFVARPIAVMSFAGGHPDRPGDARVHGLVRPQGGRDDDVLAADPVRAPAPTATRSSTWRH